VQGETHFELRFGGLATGSARVGLAVLPKLRSGEKGRCRAYRERNSTVGAESHLGLPSSGEEGGSNIARDSRMNEELGQRPGSTSQTGKTCAEGGLIEGKKKKANVKSSGQECPLHTSLPDTRLLQATCYLAKK